MSTMEQALRDEIAWHEECIKDHENEGVYWHFRHSIREHRARLAALTAALPAPGVECTGCGSRMTDAEMAAAKLLNPVLRSCCPERNLVAPGVEAPGDAVREAFRLARANPSPLEVMLAAAPSAPAEISQAQAQAMREALQGLLEIDGWDKTHPRYVAALAALTPEPPR